MMYKKQTNKQTKKKNQHANIMAFSEQIMLFLWEYTNNTTLHGTGFILNSSRIMRLWRKSLFHNDGHSQRCLRLTANFLSNPWPLREDPYKVLYTTPCPLPQRMDLSPLLRFYLLHASSKWRLIYSGIWTIFRQVSFHHCLGGYLRYGDTNPLPCLTFRPRLSLASTGCIPRDG